MAGLTYEKLRNNYGMTDEESKEAWERCYVCGAYIDYGMVPPVIVCNECEIKADDLPIQMYHWPIPVIDLWGTNRVKRRRA